MDKPENKRREPRLLDEIAVFIEMQSSPGETKLEDMCITKTLDISAHGIKVLTDLELPLHSFHQLCIETKAKRFFLVGQVAWITPQDNGIAMGFALMESEQTQILDWQTFIQEKIQ